MHYFALLYNILEYFMSFLWKTSARHLAVLQSRRPVVSWSCGLVVSQSCGLVVSWSRNLAVSWSRNLAVLQSCALVGPWSLIVAISSSYSFLVLLCCRLTVLLSYNVVSSVRDSALFRTIRNALFRTIIHYFRLFCYRISLKVKCSRCRSLVLS